MGKAVGNFPHQNIIKHNTFTFNSKRKYFILMTNADKIMLVENASGEKTYSSLKKQPRVVHEVVSLESQFFDQARPAREEDGQENNKILPETHCSGKPDDDDNDNDTE
jgi:hypothetical protein